MDSEPKTGDSPEGWGWPGRANKAHYFRDGRALCGRWMYFGPLDGDRRHSTVDCVVCTRKLGVVDESDGR